MRSKNDTKFTRERGELQYFHNGEIVHFLFLLKTLKLAFFLILLNVRERKFKELL